LDPRPPFSEIACAFETDIRVSAVSASDKKTEAISKTTITNVIHASAVVNVTATTFIVICS
jgi:hypothetical protein